MIKAIEQEISRDRRAFIKKVLGGTIAGSLLLVIPAGAVNLTNIPEQITGMPIKMNIRYPMATIGPGLSDM